MGANEAAVDAAARAMAHADESQEFTYPELARAALAAPLVADAFADAETLAKVRAIVAETVDNDDEDIPVSYIYADGFDAIADLLAGES